MEKFFPNFPLLLCMLVLERAHTHTHTSQEETFIDTHTYPDSSYLRGMLPHFSPRNYNRLHLLTVFVLLLLVVVFCFIHLCSSINWFIVGI